MAKAILLLSGGLDSTLAGKLLLTMGHDLEAVNFVSPFCCCTPRSLGCSAAKKAATQLGIKVHVFSCGEEYLEVIKRPRFGRGSGMNPCIDCRIHMFSRARRFMIDRGADFVATGEVLNERPMSQRLRTMRIIERESSLEGLIVRPLSAQRLPPSIPERNGLVDRSRLKALHGRSRRPQFALASELDIQDYLCPAGGCLLTDPEYAARMRDLLAHNPDAGLSDVKLLKIGRHFRLPSGLKVVVGRDQAENDAIESAHQENGRVLLLPRRVPGPSVLCAGALDEGDLSLAAQLLAAHTKDGETMDVEIKRDGRVERGEILRDVRALSGATYSPWRIGADRAARRSKNRNASQKGAKT